MGHTRTNLLYHLIFGTKHAKRWIRPEFGPRLHAYLAGTTKHLGGHALAVNGHEEHVHLLVRLPPTLDISAYLCKLKANSSKWTHETVPDMAGFAWQEGYGAFTVSPSLVPRVIAYIDGQAEHHRRYDFRTEWIMLCKAHGIDVEGLED
jgi:REP element-mobilizing transposase RayT